MSDDETEFSKLRSLPGRHILAVEVGGRWLASASEWPLLLAEGATAEAAISDLLRQVERISARPIATATSEVLR